jgi:hypothetical protein
LTVAYETEPEDGGKARDIRALMQQVLILTAFIDL